MKIVSIASALLILSTCVASAEFKGSVKLKPSGCQQAKYCWLVEDFGYIDKNGIGWQADKDDKTDGASIPKWAQRFVGIPYTPAYLKAAVLHDHYSKSVRPVRGWLETQRMFHEVLLKSGVSRGRASVLFAGVLIGSGKWITKMKGKKCNTGAICYNNVAKISLEREPESYEDPAYQASFKRMRTKIEASPTLTISEIEDIALAERPGSIYLKNKSGIIQENLDAWPWPTK